HRAFTRPTSNNVGPKRDRSTNPQFAGIALAGIDAHGAGELVPHFARLPGLPREPLRPPAVVGIFLPLLARDRIGERLRRRDWQLHQLGDFGIADDALGVASLRHGFHVLEKAIADHRDAAIARAEQLLAAIRDRALADPGDDVLVDDVARDPAAVGVLDRPV